MKRILSLLLCVAIPLFGFMACNGEIVDDFEDPIDNPDNPDTPDNPDNPSGPKNETITASIVDGQDLFSWAATDYVAFYNGTTYVKSAAASPSGAGKSAKIKVNYSGTRGSYAYYPFYLVQDPYTDVNGESILPGLNSSTTAVILPDSYTLDQVSGVAAPCPMIADNSGDGWEFKQLCGLLKLTVNGLPAGSNKLEITFDKDVTGVFTVSNPDSSSPSIAAANASTKNVVKIALTGATSLAGLVLNIPVPTGNVNVSSVVAMMDDEVVGTLKAVVSGWSVARAKGKEAPAAFTPSMAGLILAPGNLYTDNGKLAISSNCYDHIYMTDSVTDYTINDATKYSCANRTHFNCNELYYLMCSTGLTSMPTMEISATNYNNAETYESLVKKDFGDGKSWRVPSKANWGAIFSAARPGAKLEITIGSESPVEKDNCAFLRVTVSDMEGELGNGAEGAFCGFILFPDNVAIPAKFVALTIENINLNDDSDKDTAFTRNQITKSELDALIAAGCTFIPAAGMVNNVAFSNNNLACNYLSSSQYSETQDDRLRAQRNTIGYEVHTNKTGPFSSVRLVRNVD